MNRKQIHKEIENKKTQIQELKKDLIELYRQDCLLCDDEQWYTEEEEEYIISKRPKKVEKHLVGRIRWKEVFYDDSNGEAIEIERNKPVKVDDEWIF